MKKHIKLADLSDFIDKTIQSLKNLRKCHNVIVYHFLEAKTSFDKIEIYLN